MNFTKKIALLLCVTISYNSFHAMEEHKQISGQIVRENLYYARENLYKAAMEGQKDHLENILSTLDFDFISLSKAYIAIMEQSARLTPSKKLRADFAHQEAVKKMHIQRDNALSALSQNTKDQINETLVDKGKLYFTCAQIIYSRLEPYIQENNNATIISLHLILTKNFTEWENFISRYEAIIDFNFQDYKHGKTMLHLATKQNSLDIVTYLIKRNVDCNSQTYYQKHKKKRKRPHETLLHYVNKKQYRSTQKRPHKTALHYAVKAHNLLAIELLLSSNCDSNIVDYHGNPPLHYVGPGRSGNVNIFNMLIKAHAKIDGRDGNGQTLLYKAVKANDHLGVNFLLKYAADPIILCLKDETDSMSISEDLCEWDKLHNQIRSGEIEYSESPSHNYFESPMNLANRQPMRKDTKYEESRMEIIWLLDKHVSTTK